MTNANKGGSATPTPEKCTLAVFGGGPRAELDRKPHVPGWYRTTDGKWAHVVRQRQIGKTVKWHCSLLVDTLPPGATEVQRPPERPRANGGRVEHRRPMQARPPRPPKGELAPPKPPPSGDLANMDLSNDAPPPADVPPGPAHVQAQPEGQTAARVRRLLELEERAAKGDGESVFKLAAECGAIRERLKTLPPGEDRARLQGEADHLELVIRSWIRPEPIPATPSPTPTEAAPVSAPAAPTGPSEPDPQPQPATGPERA